MPDFSTRSFLAPRRGGLRSLWALLLLSAIAPVPPASAQGETAFVSPFLPPGHWAVDVVRDLGSLGAAASPIEPGRTLVMVGEAAALLEQISTEGGSGAPGVAALARAYRARLAEEYPALAESGLVGWRSLAVAAEAGVERRAGERTPGSIRDFVWTPGRAVPDHDGATLGGRAGASLTRALALSVAGGRMGGAWKVEEAYAVGGWRGLGGWLGRRPLGYGQAAGGSIVLNPSLAFDGGGIFLTRPWRPPGLLRPLGDVYLETALSRVDSVGAVGSPWFWTARASLTPHRRLTIGVTRAAVFGGEGVEPITFGNVLEALVGSHVESTDSSTNFENQLISVDLRYRVPLPFPLVAYGEWGAEDSAGAFSQVPGFVVGAVMPAVPRMPAIAVGLEYTSFAPACCSNPPWYQHSVFTEGWAMGGRPLGHGLGGHGNQYLLFGRAAPLDARLRASLGLYARERGNRNIFAPQWIGGSRGGTLRMAFRASPRLELEVDAEVEDGRGDWRRSLASAVLRWHF